MSTSADQTREAAVTMFSARFHGRGGQGVVTAAELVAAAAFSECRHAPAFPSSGSERMGAPVIMTAMAEGIVVGYDGQPGSEMALRGPGTRAGLGPYVSRS